MGPRAPYSDRLLVADDAPFVVAMQGPENLSLSHNCTLGATVVVSTHTSTGSRFPRGPSPWLTHTQVLSESKPGHP
jgi:hypothetical protein